MLKRDRPNDQQLLWSFECRCLIMLSPALSLRFRLMGVDQGERCPELGESGLLRADSLKIWSTFLVSKPTGSYPVLDLDTAGTNAVSQAGATVLVDTIRATGLDQALTAALSRWRAPTATHDPAKILCDLTLTLALGGDCLADVTSLRTEPDLFGLVASDPTVSRLIDTLARDADRALAAVNTTRAHVRATAWAVAADQAPDHNTSADHPLIVDLDATLLDAHSDKENAARTFKHRYGFHPLCAFVDHGGTGTGEPLAMLLRPGNAGSNTAADHITVTREALRQLPFTAKRRTCRTESADPHRRRRRHPRVHRLARGPHAVLLAGVHLARGHGRPRGPDSRHRVDTGLRRRTHPTRGCLGGRGHRSAGPVELASGDAGHRPQGTGPIPARNYGSPTPTGCG